MLQDSIGWLAALAGAGCGWLLFIATPIVIAEYGGAHPRYILRPACIATRNSPTEEWRPSSRQRIKPRLGAFGDRAREWQ